MSRQSATEGRDRTESRRDNSFTIEDTEKG